MEEGDFLTSFQQMVISKVEERFSKRKSVHNSLEVGMLVA